MAFGDAGILDDFNRSDRNLSGDTSSSGAVWSTIAMTGTAMELAITSNQMSVPGSRNGYLPGPYGPNVELWCTVSVLPGAGAYVFLAVRAQDVGAVSTWDGYGLIYIVGTGWQLRRYLNGTSTTLTSSATPILAAGDGMGFSVIQSRLTAYRNPAGAGWIPTGLAITDATYSAPGAIGLELNDTTVRIDNLGGGAFTDAAIRTFNPIPFMR